MAAHHAPLSLGFFRQEHWSGLPFPSPMHESEKWKWSHSVVSDSLRSHRLQPTRLLHPWDFLGKSTGLVCHCLLLKLIWWCWILLFIFSSSIQPLIPPSNLNENFAGKNILGHMFSNNPPIIPIFLPRESLRQRSLVGYSPWDHKELDMMEATWHGTAQVLPFPHFKYIMPLHQACRVSAQKSSDDLMGIPLYIIIFYLVAFNVFSLSVFIHLITICLGVFLLGFVLPETLYTSCTWVPISFLMWGRFSAVISSNIRDVCNMNTGALNAVPEISLKIFIYFHFFFILFCSSDFHHSIFLLTYPFFCLICSAIYSSIF